MLRNFGLTASVHFFALSIIFGAFSLINAQNAIAVDSTKFGMFGEIYCFRPLAETKYVTLMVCSQATSNKDARTLAIRGAENGVCVVLLSGQRYVTALQKSKDACLYPAGDFEMVSKFIQQYEKIPTYLVPTLLGIGAASPLVYAAVAASPAATFRGAVCVDFSPDLPGAKPFCKGAGLVSQKMGTGMLRILPAQHITIPLVFLHSKTVSDSMAQLTMAYTRESINSSAGMSQETNGALAPESVWVNQAVDAIVSMQKDFVLETGTMAEFKDIPITEFRSGTPDSIRPLVIYFTGDGGWDVSDKGIGHALIDSGIGMVGINSLRYFWTEHNPDSVTHDVERIIGAYEKKWKTHGVVLVGYSFGADVIPFVASRLSLPAKNKIQKVIIISPSQRADFSFHLGSWFGKTGTKSLPVLPEIKKCLGMGLVCFYGKHDEESLGPDVTNLCKTIVLVSGHRVGNEFDAIVKEIVRSGPL